MPVRRDDGRTGYRIIEVASDAAGSGIGGKRYSLSRVVVIGMKPIVRGQPPICQPIAKSCGGHLKSERMVAIRARVGDLSSPDDELGV